MHSKYLISVIIPVYNTEHLIEECIDSLQQQSLSKSEFEVIVVDDCSTDGTLWKVQGLKTDLNIRVVELDKNSGPGIARNKGVDLAQGTFILFLDADDYLLPEALERLSKHIQNDECDLITFNWTYFSDLESTIAPVPRRCDLKDMPAERSALVSHYLGMNMDGSVIYSTAKRSLFDKYSIRFPEGYHEDMSVIFQMYFAAENILKLDEILYVKKNTEGSIINTFSKKHVGGYLNAWPLIFQFLRKQGWDTENYIADYYRGMSGHVYTMLTKNLDANHGDFASRKLFYGFILEALERDENLRQPYSDLLPDVTDKDQLSQLFFAHMSAACSTFGEKVRNFENDYFCLNPRHPIS